MVGMVVHLSISGVLVFLLFMATLYFCYRQGTKYNWSMKSLLRNQFVVLTILLCLGTLVFGVVDIYWTWLLFQLERQEKTTPVKVIAFVIPISLSNMVSTAAHSFILYFRGRVILKYISRKVLRLMEVVIRAFAVFFFISVVTIFLLLMKKTDTFQLVGTEPEVWDFMYWTATLPYGVCFCMIDLISSISFFMHQRRNRKLLNNQKFIRLTSQDIIAKSGLVISLTSLFGLFSFASNALVANQFIAHWFVLTMYASFVSIAVLWILLKIKLDGLSDQEKQKSQTVCGNSQDTQKTADEHKQSSKAREGDVTDIRILCDQSAVRQNQVGFQDLPRSPHQNQSS